jgi:hypothetical protein
MQIGLKQRKQALGSMLMHITVCLFLLDIIEERMKAS